MAAVIFVNDKFQMKVVLGCNEISIALLIALTSPYFRFWALPFREWASPACLYHEMRRSQTDKTLLKGFSILVKEREKEEFKHVKFCSERPPLQKEKKKKFPPNLSRRRRRRRLGRRQNRF